MKHLESEKQLFMTVEKKRVYLYFSNDTQLLTQTICNNLKKDFENLDLNIRNLNIYKINYDEMNQETQNEMKKKYNFSSFPTFVFLNHTFNFTLHQNDQNIINKIIDFLGLNIDQKVINGKSINKKIVEKETKTTNISFLLNNENEEDECNQ